jgi:thiol:disulfide interchange protein DsbD
MYKIVTSFFIYSLLISFQALALGTNAEKHVEMSAESFAINDEVILSVTLVHDKSWHTYWKNPGDAGLTTKFMFNIDGKKVTLDEYPWPTPKRYIEAGNILAYGYGKTQHYFFKLKKDFNMKSIKIHGQWLVCKDICIPGEDKVEVNLVQALGKTQNHKTEISTLISAFKALPKKLKAPKNLELFLTKAQDENKLVLQYTFSNINIENFDRDANLLTPYLVDLFDYKHESIFYDEENKTLYGRMYLDWNGIYEDPEMLLSNTGLFDKPIKTSFLLQFDKTKNPQIISHQFKNFSLKGDKSLNEFLKKLTPLNAVKKTTQTLEGKNILYFILFAFLGGLILNLMPCVLPVISLKLFGLIAHSDESKGSILKHNLAYTAGVISTFMALGAVIIFLKSTGEKIGWGFQLQSPSFVFAMLIVLLIMSMNMLGLFEFITPGGRTLGNAELKKGFSGDFLNGVLATILSTPCSAPFLGTALTFAFTTGTVGIFLIFFFVGLGLAFPFILTGVFPKTVSFLPKPGAWMDKLKNILGFTLILTFIWLYDVFMNIVDFNYFGIYYNAIFASLFMAFFFRKKITQVFIWNLILFAIPIAITVSTISSDGLEVSDETSQVSNNSELDWEKWSEAKMQELASESKWVFVDFTAKWCLTCKVNKKLVFNTDAFLKLIEDEDISLLVADWTKRDDYITDFLQKYNIVGVPAYFLQSPSGKVIHLGETISISKLREAIKSNQ